MRRKDDYYLLGKAWIWSRESVVKSSEEVKGEGIR